MVIWTVLNRAKARTNQGHPLWWGGDIVSVITHPYQYSSMTAPNDPQLRAWPAQGDPQWESIGTEVAALTSGLVICQTDATHYFSVPLTSPPKAWGDCSLVIGGDLGRVKFYKLGAPTTAQPAPPAASTALG
jgi:hypothetical protein